MLGQTHYAPDARDVQQAIDDSITHDAIVTIEWTAGREATLRSLADDYTEGNDVIEYWAAADDLGDEAVAWRVRLDTRWRRLLDEVAAIVGDDGTDVLGVVVRQALSDDAEATAEDIAAIVREAIADAAADD